MTGSRWKKPKFILAFSLSLFFLFATLFLTFMEEIWRENGFLPLDQAVNHLMAANRQHDPYDWLFFLAITDMGEGGVLAALTLLIAAGLWFYRRTVESLLLLGGFVITGMSVGIIKFITDRARPPGAALLHETSGAFPSSHAALSFFFFGFIGYLLAQRVKKKSLRMLVFTAGLLAAGLIGMSRIYLNVHWTSDVLAGFALAAEFLSLCIGLLEIRKLRIS